MIILFTDFGSAGGYVGQLEMVLHRLASGIRVVNLLSDAPPYDVLSSSHLLAAFSSRFCPGDVVVSVVDPGVGTEDRIPTIMCADAVWYVGPGNGLVDVVARRARNVQFFRITWFPPDLSNTFHGRDLFAPVAAHIANGSPIDSVATPTVYDLTHQADKDLWRIIYFDGYGNAITGLRGDALRSTEIIVVGDWQLRYAPTFGAHAHHKPFWYVNSLGLVELAVNCGSAKDVLRVAIGDSVSVARMSP